MRQWEGGRDRSRVGSTTGKGHGAGCASTISMSCGTCASGIRDTGSISRKCSRAAATTVGATPPIGSSASGNVFYCIEQE